MKKNSCTQKRVYYYLIIGSSGCTRLPYIMFLITCLELISPSISSSLSSGLIGKYSIPNCLLLLKKEVLWETLHWNSFLSMKKKAIIEIPIHQEEEKKTDKRQRYWFVISRWTFPIHKKVLTNSAGRKRWRKF